MKKTLLVLQKDLATLVERVGINACMDAMIAHLTRALREVSESRSELYPRAGFSYEFPHPGVFEWMPHMRSGHHTTLKLVAYNPVNPTTTGLPTILSTIGIFDLATGHLVALVDGTFLTALRTGAASAIASRILSHPDSRTLGLVGCGAQAVTQFHALSRVFKLQEALVYDIEPDRAQSFARRAAFIGIPVRVARLREVEAAADILCTATTVAVGAGPVLQHNRLLDHVHINAVGSDLRGKTELPLSLLRESLLCPDHRQQALFEGECQQVSAAEIGPDLAELVQHPESYSPWQSKKTIFDSTGLGLEDNIAAGMLLELVHEYELGTEVRLEHCPSDAYNPYDFSLPTDEVEEQIK